MAAKYPLSTDQDTLSSQNEVNTIYLLKKKKMNDLFYLGSNMSNRSKESRIMYFTFML